MKSSRTRASESTHALPSAIPLPTIAPLPDGRSFNVLITGVGGTGIVTIGAVLGMAAHIDGTAVSVVDQLGFAQKGGSVVTHIRLAKQRSDIHAPRINSAATDTLLACDMLVSGHDKINPALDTDRTVGVVNTTSQITGDFTQNGDLGFPVDTLESRLLKSTKQASLFLLPASQLALATLGDTLAANLMITGYAWQKGMLPISREAIQGAIELNGIAVDWNIQAFEWGRALAHEPELLHDLLKPKADVITLVEDAAPQALGASLASELERYHNLAYASDYQQWLTTICSQIEARVGSRPDLCDTLARALYKLMAYKDEYEVARLHSAPEFLQSLSRQFEGDYKLAFYLAPPLISRVDQVTGRPQKIRFGAWMLPAFKLLAKFKFLRHTAFDPFGYTAERKLERQLIADYKTTIEDLVTQLSSEKVAELLAIAGLPMTIRGYGHVKLASVERYQAELRERLEGWQDAASKAAA